MTTEVVFETATLQSSIKKAALIAPGSGRALEAAAGIVIEVYPSTGAVVIKSTNLESFYLEFVDSVEMSGDDVSWRIPSNALATWVGKLPIGTGKIVKFSGDREFISVTSARKSWSCSTINPDYYPLWSPINVQGIKTDKVQEMGERLNMVTWAVDKKNDIPPTNGIYFDGERVWATDGYKLATIPCKVDLDSPVTVPASIIVPLIKSMGDTRVFRDGNFLVFMPDDYTQIRTVIFGVPFKPVERATSIVYPNLLMVDKKTLVSSIQAMSQASKDKLNEIELVIGNEEIALRMEDEGIQSFADCIEIPGMAEHDPFVISFSADNLATAINSAPNDKVVLKYDPSRPKGMFHIDGGQGYLVWTAPRMPAAREAS